jgi:hypothetical protein
VTVVRCCSAVCSCAAVMQVETSSSCSACETHWQLMGHDAPPHLLFVRQGQLWAVQCALVAVQLRAINSKEICPLPSLSNKL